MAIQLAKRLAAVKPSATLALNAKAKQLIAEGKDIINLAVGEPDFNTPEFIKEAAIEALAQNFTRYTQTGGILELRQAICQKLQRDNQLDYKPEQVIVSTGLKQSLFNLMLATLNPGDEVIIPAPYWVSYPDMVLLAEAVPVFITASLQNNLKLTADALAKAITPKTKMIILNSPSNPSGVVYQREDLQAIADVLKQHPNIIIASDDMYEHIYWGTEKFVNILNVAPELFDRTMVLNGFSKTYAMTGFRMGYGAGPIELIKAMDMIQSQSTSSPNSIAQKAATAALLGPQQCVADMANAFHQRYEYLANELAAIPGIIIPKAQGAFYFYPNVQGLIDRLGLADDFAFSNYLLEELGIAVLPGSTCGTPGFVRFSFAASQRELTETVKRLKAKFLD